MSKVSDLQICVKQKGKIPLPMREVGSGSFKKKINWKSTEDSMMSDIC